MKEIFSNVFLQADSRGLLGVIEENEVPFDVRRVFWISSIPQDGVRGEHAHRSCKQLIVCAKGSVHLHTEKINGETQSIPMTQGNTYYLSPYTWLTLTNFSTDAVVIVLASEPYNENEYIRSYDEFKRIAQ